MKDCPDCVNVKVLSTASYKLAEEFYPNKDEKSTLRRKKLAMKIRKLAKHYGDIRVHQERSRD